LNSRIRLGMLTPSSNTVLEPMTSAMISSLPEVSAHFARFPVTEISLTDRALGQFDNENILRAARLLADAHVDVIGWNGTSSGWLGFEVDERLCREITAETGIVSTTSVLALNEILKARNATEFALVTPYIDDVQRRIVAVYEQAGFCCVTERHLGLHVNFSFSEVTEDEIRRAVHEVAAAQPKAITIFCTNLRAAHLAAALERELRIPVYDTVSTVVWKSLRLAGVDPGRIQDWGSLFSEERLDV
jgi:maleate isomerase